MAAAAAGFLATLSTDGQRRALIGFADKERLNWHYVPRRREGLAFKDMPAPARAAAHELMKASLSAVGYAKAVNVIRLEEVLRRLETFGALLRDPENYSITVFGHPAAAAPWGWRLEGHHLSLNFTLVPGKPIAMTPAFLGANPAEVPAGPHQGLRALAAEQDLARTLARSVEPRLRPRLIIDTRSLGDIVSGPGRALSLATTAGLPLADLTGDQRSLALRLVEEYAHNMRAELAAESSAACARPGSSRCTSPGRARSSPARPTTTGSTAPRFSSSTTIPRTTPTTSTPYGMISAMTSARIFSGRTRRPPAPRLTETRHDHQVLDGLRRPRGSGRHGQQATPVNERRYSNEHLVSVFTKTEAMARCMDDHGYDALWFAEHHFQHEGYECIPNMLMSACTWRTSRAAAVRLRLQHHAHVASPPPGGGFCHRRHLHRRAGASSASAGAITRARWRASAAPCWMRRPTARSSKSKSTSS